MTGRQGVECYTVLAGAARQYLGIVDTIVQ
jgi:hypothetical protein